ncbi:MAG TPA: DUF3006 domain-containing protein [Patescibacteria group bacterium]
MTDEVLDVSQKKFHLKAVIDRFEGIMAVLKFDDNQEINWPIKNLPEDCQAGSVVRLIISTSKTDQEEREKMAKTLLNEILKK